MITFFSSVWPQLGKYTLNTIYFQDCCMRQSQKLTYKTQNFIIIIISLAAFAEGNVTVWMPFVPSKATLAVPHLCVMTQLLARYAIIYFRFFPGTEVWWIYNSPILPTPLSPFLRGRHYVWYFPLFCYLSDLSNTTNTVRRGFSHFFKCSSRPSPDSKWGF